MLNQTGAAVGGNFTLNNAGITGLSGAATTFSTGKAVDYCVNGVALTKAAVTGGATPTTDAVSGKAFKGQVANTAAVYVFALDAAGNVKVAQGAVVPYTDTTAKSTVCPLPMLPDTLTPFAYAVLKAGATTVGTWTFGSSNWNATGITIDTPVNVVALPPSDPLTA